VESRSARRLAQCVVALLVGTWVSVPLGSGPAGAGSRYDLRVLPRGPKDTAKPNPRTQKVASPTSTAPAQLALSSEVEMISPLLAALRASTEKGTGWTPNDWPAVELAYLRSATLPSGALLRRPRDTKIIPYWGNYATIGLAAISAKQPEAATMGWDWLTWYAEHQDPLSGFITDYNVMNAVETSTGAHDSTDAYAGTYLLAVEAMWQATRCITCIEKLARSVELAVAAIVATQDADGLTWAQPIGRVKYLMDQAEVAAGLRSAGVLAEVYGNQALAGKVASIRQAHDRGLRGMVQPLNGGPMVWAISENEVVARTFELSSARVLVDDAKLYPDSLGPVFFAALAADLAPPIAHDATNSYITTWHRWSEDPDIWGFPVLVGWALMRTGNVAAATDGTVELRKWITDGYRGDALTVGHVGQLLAISRNVR
jgi:hypothetical protein